MLDGMVPFMLLNIRFLQHNTNGSYIFNLGNQRFWLQIFGKFVKIGMIIYTQIF